MVLLLITPMKTRWKETLKYLGEIKGLCFEGDSLVDAMVKKKKTMESSTKMKLPSKYALGGKELVLTYHNNHLSLIQQLSRGRASQ